MLRESRYRSMIFWEHQCLYSSCWEGHLWRGNRPHQSPQAGVFWGKSEKYKLKCDCAKEVYIMYRLWNSHCATNGTMKQLRLSDPSRFIYLFILSRNQLCLPQLAFQAEKLLYLASRTEILFLFSLFQLKCRLKNCHDSEWSPQGWNETLQGWPEPRRGGWRHAAAIWVKLQGSW